MIAVLGVAALLAALLGPAARAGAADVQDMLGRLVPLAGPPARVVSLAPSLTEVVHAVGAGERLVAVTDQCDFPDDVKGKPRVGGIYTPNFEVILSLRPDLVLATTEGNRAEHIEGLERLGLPVYVVRPTSFLTVLESIARVGGVLGREAAARGVIAAMQREVDGIARALAGVRRPRVLYVLWGNPLIVPGRDTLITDLIRLAGGESVSGEEPLAYPRLSVEEAVAREPDRVVLARQGPASVADRLREWPYLTLLAAVRQGKVHPIDGDLMHRPGPRIIDGVRALARALHPGVAW